ncbi:MAG: class I SAM-dependent methyltransferase [bacterium]
MKAITDLIHTLSEMPRLTIDLMEKKTAGNDPFYTRLVSAFYRDARRRHRKFPLIRAFEWGVAVCVLPRTFEQYIMSIEASARRNHKKALRSGYAFRKIVYNDHLADIKAIWCSTPVRQGKLPKSFFEAEVQPCSDPLSNSPFHAYSYFGVFKGDQLVAYGGGMVAGEVFCLEQIFGHDAFLADGVVPMLIIGIAESLFKDHPNVRYYAYGTFLGAGKTMRRFKTKFGFLPHKVRWILNGFNPGGMGFYRSLYNWFICPHRMLAVRRYMRNEAPCLLDIGCGNHGSRVAKTYFPECCYHGVDKQRWNWTDSDDQWVDKLYRLDLDERDVLSQVPDGHYDAVICSHVLAHLRQPYDVIRELARKVKGGGLIYIEVPAERSLSLPRAHDGWWGIRGCLNFHDDASHIALVNLRQIAVILEKDGFRVLRLGRCLAWRRVVFLPLYIVSCLVVKGFIPASVVWDITGFAEGLTAIRLPPDEGGRDPAAHR